MAGGRAIDRLVFCGFSQGVAMAFRAGLLGARKADAVLALGGDVPPELLADAGNQSSRACCSRAATRDEWYTERQAAAPTKRALQARGAAVDTLTFDGAHEWHEDFARAGRRDAELACSVLERDKHRARYS